MRSFGDIEVVVGRPFGAVDGLPVVPIRAVLATVALVTVTVVLGVTVPIAGAGMSMLVVVVWARTTRTDQGCASGRGCRGDHGRSHGPGRGHDDRPSWASSHDDAGSANDGVEKSGAVHAPVRYGRTATKRKAEYEPTKAESIHWSG
jgi:hypothetical protein